MPLIFFLLLYPEGGSSDGELYDSVVVMCVWRQSLRKTHFSDQRNWEKGTLGANECGENPIEKRTGKGNPSNFVNEWTEVLGLPPSTDAEQQHKYKTAE